MIWLQKLRRMISHSNRKSSSYRRLNSRLASRTIKSCQRYTFQRTRTSALSPESSLESLSLWACIATSSWSKNWFRLAQKKLFSTLARTRTWRPIFSARRTHSRLKSCQGRSASMAHLSSWTSRSRRMHRCRILTSSCASWRPSISSSQRS